MAGSKILRKIQLGREATPGTAVAATTIWRGMGVLVDERETVYVEEDVGILSGTDRSYVPRIGGIIEFSEIPATFEQLPHILEAGVKTVTPAADGAGSDYIYTYDFATTSKNTIKTYTIEGGDDQQAEEMEYAFVESFGISGENGGVLMMSANWRGRQVANSTFTGSVALPTVEDIIFTKAKLYVDAIGGTWGTTQMTETLLAMNLQVTTGVMPKYHADGNLYFSTHQFVKPEITLEMELEHNANAVTEKGYWRSQTPRLLQLLIEGSALGTPGTTYSKKTIILNLAGKWTNFGGLDERDGNDFYPATFTCRYNPTAAKFAQIIVVNELSTLP